MERRAASLKISLDVSILAAREDNARNSRSESRKETKYARGG